MNVNNNDSLIQALEECLELMEKGTNLEQAVERYSTLAAELRPMLEAAEAAGNLVNSIQVPSGVQAHSRATFLNTAETYKNYNPLHAIAQRSAQKVQRKPFFFNLAQATLILLAILTIGSATVVGASARSLPGDVLYPVKLAAEQTQLLFTLAPQERIKLEQTFDGQRLKEIQTLTARSRTPNVGFAGKVEPSGEFGWQVGGVELVIEDPSEMEELLESGLYLGVTGKLLSNGSVEVTQLRPREYNMKGKIESFSSTEWVVSSVLVRLTTVTTIKGSPAIGLEAEIKGYLFADGGLQAREIKVKGQRASSKTQEVTQEIVEPVDETLEPTRTPRPERTRTVPGEPGKATLETDEPDKTEIPKTDEESDDPGEPTEKPKPTDNG